MNLKTREWISFIIIIVLVQFLIQVAAWLYSGNSGALNYISFAGTLISIVLAVLAIIYSYVQSVSQTNTTISIGKQVDSLIDATRSIDVSKDQLLGTLGALQGISEKIDNSISHQKTLRDRLDQIYERVGHPLDGMAQSMGESSNDKKQVFDVVEINIESSAHGFQTVLVFIYYGYRLGFDDEKIKNELLMPMGRSFFLKDAPAIVESFHEGMFSGAKSVIETIGVIAVNDGFSIINAPYLGVIEAFVDGISISGKVDVASDPDIHVFSKKFCIDYMDKNKLTFCR